MPTTANGLQEATPENILKRIYYTLGMLPFILVALIIIMGILNPRFLTYNNFIIVLRQACFLALVSCGQMLVILTKGVDVSLGAIIGLCSVCRRHRRQGVRDHCRVAYPCSDRRGRGAAQRCGGGLCQYRFLCGHPGHAVYQSRDGSDHFQGADHL